MHIKQKGDENPSLKKSAVALLELSWEWNSGKPFYLNFRSEWWCLPEGATGCWNNIVTYFYPLKSNLLLSHDSNRNFIHASLQLVFQTVQFFILLDWEFTDRYVNVPYLHKSQKRIFVCFTKEMRSVKCHWNVIYLLKSALNPSEI